MAEYATGPDESLAHKPHVVLLIYAAFNRSARRFRPSCKAFLEAARPRLAASLSVSVAFQPAFSVSMRVNCLCMLTLFKKGVTILFLPTSVPCSLS